MEAVIRRMVHVLRGGVTMPGYGQAGLADVDIVVTAMSAEHRRGLIQEAADAISAR